MLLVIKRVGITFLSVAMLSGIALPQAAAFSGRSAVRQVQAATIARVSTASHGALRSVRHQLAVPLRALSAQRAKPSVAARGMGGIRHSGWGEVRVGAALLATGTALFFVPNSVLNSFSVTADDANFVGILLDFSGFIIAAMGLDRVVEN